MEWEKKVRQIHRRQEEQNQSRLYAERRKADNVFNWCFILVLFALMQNFAVLHRRTRIGHYSGVEDHAVFARLFNTEIVSAAHVSADKNRMVAPDMASSHW